MARVFFQRCFSSRSKPLIASACGRFTALGVLAGICLAVSENGASAFNTLRNGNLSSRGSSSSAAATSQTATEATTATSQTAATNVLAQHAQAAYTRSVQALQALQAAQASARAAAINGANNLGVNPLSPGQALPNVPDGLAVGGLVPGVQGTDPADPSTVAHTVSVTANGNGTRSVTLANDSAITLPASVSGTTQITASGTGVVGTVTLGETVTPLTGGVATSVAPGSTVSITQTGGATVTFASGSAGIPATFSTYNYGSTGSAPAPASWSGVGGLTQSTFGAGQTTVTITQTQQQALLSWQTFNIGKNTTLDFDQSAGGANVSQWVAINTVGNSVAPSQILGAIQAPGQVYVIDQNGIIFGGSSQVNVGALTASSLALNPAYVTNGLLNDGGNDYQFQFSSLFTTSQQLVSVNGHNVLTTVVAPLWTAPAADATGTVPAVASVPTGDVTVQAGAELSSPTNAESQGGRIALIGPNVVNDGTISTPDGQTILAAGLQVGLTAHDANDASLRGLDVFIGQVSGVASTLPTGTFVFDGLPNGGELTFAGTGQVGTYTPPNTTTPIALTANTPVAIPAGSSVTLTSGAPTFAAVQAGTVTNAANVLDGNGNVVTPGGDIESLEASVILAGQTVNQMGIINGSTSVTLNGRIDLLADYNSGVASINNEPALFPFATGDVNLGSQSVTQILPELSSTATTIGTELPFSSIVNIQGLNIEMLPGSLLLAPGAEAPPSTSSPALNLIGSQLTSGVTLDAGSWYQVSNYSVFSNNDGQISLDAGSTIDVSGSENVSASVAEDIVAAQLRGPELSNSPLQRNGPLREATVYIDIRDTGVDDGTAWVGTPIADVSGYANDIERTVGELTTDGGTVTLSAGTAVSIASGATVNVSGGWINYAGANVPSTKVVSNGQVLDISQATPDQVYQGLLEPFTATSTKWGTSETFGNSLVTDTQFDPGYIQGGNSGSVSIAAPSMALGGNLYGNTVAGAYQLTPQAGLSSTYAGATFLPTTLKISGIPQAGSLDLAFLQSTANNSPKVYAASSPDIEFQTDSFISQNAPATNQILLSQDIVDSDGFGNLTIDTSASGSILVPAGVSLTTPFGGSIDFTAANIDIEGSVSAPGGGSTGGLDFTVLDLSPTVQTGLVVTPPSDPTRGHFTLGPDASLSSSGLLVDDRPTSSAPNTLPLALAGGTISIAALDLDLAPGSTIDVSGGAAISSIGKVTYGNAGKISLLGGEDPATSSLVSGGELILGSTLTGYSGNVGGGGALTVQAPLVQIGGATLLNGESSTSAFVAGESAVSSKGTTLWLDPSPGSNQGEFFSEGGFGNFDIEGLGQIETDGAGAYLFDAAGDPIVSPAIVVAPNTVLHPIVQSSVATFNGNSLSLAPLTPTQAGALLPSQRTAVNLTLNAEGVSGVYPNDGPPTVGGGTVVGGSLLVRGDLVMNAGSSIQTDPQTNSSHGVSLLASHGTVAVLGSILAPGGTITVAGGNTSGLGSNQLLFYESSTDQPFPTVDLGPNSVLSTAGTFEQTLNSDGYVTGSVLPGGSINVSGNIVAEAGATLNVSGAIAAVGETPTAVGESSGRIQELAPVSTLISSNGGAITLKGTQLLYSDATLLGAAGGAGAEGGSLSISSGPAATALSGVTPPTEQDVALIVTQNGLNGGYSLPANSPTGLAVVDGQALPSSPTDPGLSVNSALANPEPVYSYFAANPNLFVSATSDHSATNNGGVAGGFASLSLAGTLDFVGAVNITTSQSLTLAKSSGAPGDPETGGVIYADSPVVLTSPYVALNSYQTSLDPDILSDYPSASSGTGSLTVNASVLADVGNVSLQNIGTLTFNANPAVGGDIRGVGTLQVSGQINLNAAQIYPPTEETFTIEANDVSITAPTSQALPSLPLSGGGTLDIDANTIEQGGVLRAPFGVINLGTSTTQSVTLSAGSITSVSGVDPTTGLGITVPYGIVNPNGTWYDPQGNDISLSGPPAKEVVVNGADVNIEGGATIDISGGGSLFAYEFTSGTGGTEDILASTGAAFSSTSFAVVPGYSLGYAPDGTYNTQSANLLTNNVTDAGYYNSSLAVGEQITLNASNGLPAGTYTLLPARYALLPGAFLITPTTGGASLTSVVEPDGYSLVAGYATNALSPTSSPLDSAYQVYSQANVLNRAPYSIDQAATYFPTSAANNNLSIPRLPADSGQVVLDATQAMTIQGALLSQAAAGGLGGQVDIASPEEIDIIGPDTANVPTGALALDSSQLTNFGASSLLIGGYRTTTDAGTSVTVTTDSLVVDNSGATTTINGTTVDGLAAPDIILVSNGSLDIADGAAIEQLGTLSGPAQALTLQGDGDLIRVSSDPTAQIARQNVVSGDTTSLLGIGQGVHILNANGGAVGALTLDSTGLVQVSTSVAVPPVLLGQSLTIGSSLINLELSAPATAPTAGLVITGPQLDSLLASSESLSLLSYSSIAFYGSGQIGAVTATASGGKTYQEASLSLHADDIYYADTANSSGITIDAQTVSFDNLAGGTTLPPLTGLGTGSLTVNAQTITLGSNAMRIDQFATVALNADAAILLKGLGTQVAGSDSTPVAASLGVGGDLVLTTPLITGATSADQAVSATTTVAIDETIDAGGSILLQAPTGDLVTSPAPTALATSLSLVGSSIAQESGSIVLHSGSLSLVANGTGSGSDVTVNGTLDVSGVSPAFYNLTKYTNGGAVALTSLAGDVAIGGTGVVNVSAASGAGSVDSGAGNGGALTVSAAGTFTPGQIDGQGGTVTQAGSIIAQGAGGTFSLDVGSLDSTGQGNGSLSKVESGLSGFSAQTIRDQNDTTVTVDGSVIADSFNLSADQGSIMVSGEINASDVAATDANGNSILIGGSITLEAGGSVTLAATGILNASGQNFSNAGEGGTVTIDAGTYEGSLPATSTAAINLATGSQIDLTVAGGSGGTLHLRAPQVAGGAYVVGAAYTPAADGGTPTDVAIAPIANGIVQNAGSILIEGYDVQDAQAANGIIDGFEASAETNAANFVANTSAMQTRLFTSSPANVEILPGEEIDNSTGSLELQSTWDLSGQRFGSASVPGVLTIRAAGDINLDFGASLNDGFSGSSGVVLDRFTLLPVGSQSWSYQLAAGADFSGANLGDVQSASALQSSGMGGSVQVGYQNTASPILLSDFSANSVNQFYQTIRTGTGSITINAGGDVLLLNNLATIYTAGSQVDGTLGGTFVPPAGSTGGVSLPATYSSGGGNVAISAQGDIAHETYDSQGDSLVADSSAEMPTNWLDREGSASLPTTWWVDFTNFFEGVGALGGGNVTLSAGGSVVNVDAVVPTNARLLNGQLTELGGGNLTVSAGNNIDGGVYYVERGQGTVTAGNNIQTNATRAAATLGQPSTAIDWLPTTFFLGTGSFDVAAGGNLLLGPVANPFLLPQSYNNVLSKRNTTAEISYFSTYDPKDAVNASSLGGTVTIQDFADSGGEGSLYAWYTDILDAAVTGRGTLGTEVSAAQPWLLLAEAASSTQVVVADFGAAGILPLGAPGNDFGGFTALLPPTLRVTAFGGDIDLVGSLTLSPSADGTVDLVAQGAINAFETNQVNAQSLTTASGSGLVNLSDADPALIPSVTSPLTSATSLSGLDALFTPTGATEDLTLQERQEFHADSDGGSLHANQPKADPAYIYAGSGDISGLTLFSAIQTQVIAGQDLTDIGLYLQNNSASDISVVEAGRDILAYDANSTLREQAGINLVGYAPDADPLGSGPGAPNSGDIQISGPGTLEVLAGRNLTLGNDAGQNPNNSTSGIGLFTGLTSVGSEINPALPFGGADLVAAAGIGSGFGLNNSNLNFTDSVGTGFTDLFLNPSSAQSARYLPDLGTLMGTPSGDTDQQIWAAFNRLDPKAQDALALDIFYQVLSDTAQDHDTPTSPNFGTYTEGDAAIAALFPSTDAYSGNLTVTSREIKTTSGGDIDLLVPGGGVTVGIEQPGGQAVDQGILTVDGGNINIFANDSVLLGTSRIFTLHGGNEVIWSSTGNIDAGAASITVVSAPPTRVLVDPTSGAVETDLAGLATGGGIGVLETVAGAPPGNIDLIAPVGTVDAGDAGIRASGKIFLAAAHVANASHISSGQGTSGAPAAPASVNLGALTAASAAAGSSQAAVQNTSQNHQNIADTSQDLPSIITVEVLGYGGGDQD